MLGISCSRCFNSLLFDKWSMPTRQHAWYFMFTMLQFASVWQVEYAYTTTCLVFHVHDASCFCLTSGVCLHDNMLGISCSRCFNSLLFDKWSMPTRQHAWYFMFTMLQFASVWQVEYAYTTTCLVFHVHDASIRFCLTSGVCLHDNMLGISCHDASIRFCLTSRVCLYNNMLGISCPRCFNCFCLTSGVCLHDNMLGISCPRCFCFCLTSGVCLHDNMLGISCSRCFNSLLFNKWSMPTRQHAWYFMFTMLQFASVWQVEYAYTTTCLVFHVHDASIRFCLTSGVCLHDNMLGISCSRCFNSSVWQVEYAYTTTCLVFHVHDASIRFCLTSGVCLHDIMLGISCSQCFNSLLFDKWSMPTRQHAWYFMFTMLQFASV